MTKALLKPADKASSLAQQNTDLTAEGSPPPGKVATTVPVAAGKVAKRNIESPFTGPLGHKRPPWGKKR